MFKLGVTGHRDIHPAMRERLAQALRPLLAELRDALPPGDLTVITALAEGADLLVGEEAEALGLALKVPVTGSVSRLLAAHGRGGEACQRMLALPSTTCEPLPGPATGKGDFVPLADHLARHSDALLALWDGLCEGPPGGTWDVVRRFLARPPTERDSDLAAYQNRVIWLRTERGEQAAGAAGPIQVVLISRVDLPELGARLPLSPNGRPGSLSRPGPKTQSIDEQ